jgi:phospholipid/cholesterol/gamma-HCH transport system ATP-binding protein
MSAVATTTVSPKNVRVEVRDLHKSFGQIEVLKGISFQVEPGEIFVIMGPSGSGKSVMLKHIAGLLTPASGEVLFENESTEDPEVRKKYRMAMVFQSAALLASLTVGENVGLYPFEHRLKSQKEISAAVTRALESVGLKGVENRAPSELSGGMQKRVALARALLVEPQLILYDEPTSELDPLMAVTIGQEILQLNQRTGATSIIVTHDRDLAFAAAKRIAMIDDGRILFIGTPQEVQNSPDQKIQQFIRAGLKSGASH